MIEAFSSQNKKERCVNTVCRPTFSSEYNKGMCKEQSKTIFNDSPPQREMQQNTQQDIRVDIKEEVRNHAVL